MPIPDITIISTPTVPVIDLDRARLAAKIVGTDRDTEVTDAIVAAGQHMQRELWQAVGDQVVEFRYKDWYGAALLPYDVTELVSVTAAGIALDSSAYVLDGRLLTSNAANAPVKVRIRTGWTAETLPAPVKQAMLLMIVDFLRNPQGQTDAQLYVNPAVEGLIALYRRRPML